MTWRFIGDLKGLEPIAGIPLSADDEDFDAAVAAYEGNDPEASGSVKASGLYEHVTDTVSGETPGASAGKGG